ncbi:hypothetical protein M0805_000485 [Coniferiporia weirii]|nr:hypothetical protein M0805_000485 [Coniferiporia weirii]
MSESESQSASPWLVAVHGGAGYHSTETASQKAVKRALRSACASATEVLRTGNLNSGRIDAIEHAICTLEDEECLNAGKGSNLTYDGEVECDASMMDGEMQHFGSVGAVQGVKNPISVARAVMDNSREPRILGRVSPLTLVGQGARAFARSRGLQTCDPESLITEDARRSWQTWKARYETATCVDSGPDSGLLHPKLTSDGDYQELEDTVGAISCDTNGGMAAGVSSGGLLLKYPGRIGEAAVFGAGVWAHSPPGTAIGVACSVSGTGEAIIRASLARTLAMALSAASPEAAHEVMHVALQGFCDDCRDCGEDDPRAGVLVVTKEIVEDSDEADDSDTSKRDDEHLAHDELDYIERPHAAIASPSMHMQPRIKLRLWCAFTTSSMAIAYASSEDPKPRALILHRPTSLPARGPLLKANGRGHVYITALPLARV